MTTPEVVYCGRCKKEVRYHFDPINHLKHLLLTVISLGIWLPIWVCVTFCPSKICDECADPIWSDPPAKAAAERRNAY